MRSPRSRARCELNFPRFAEVVFFIDGQVPRFPEKKKI